jgi:putative PIN family toxin of toxin-antitoxin system
MSTSALKIVLDINILVAIIGKKSPYRWVFDCIIEGRLILCISTEILLEYREILAFKNGKEVAENVCNLIVIHPLTIKTEIFYNFQLVPHDEDDNKYVDCAIASNAFCLVSNDAHFRQLKNIPFPKVNILTLLEFEEKFKAQLTGQS